MPAASPHSTKQSHDSQCIELLTQQAFEASQAGDWDRVDACYTRRGISLQTCVLDQAVVQRMLAIDERVRAAVLVAQAAIFSLLADTAQVKQQLRRLRESAGQSSSTHGALHREA
ncbi:MAG: hypothetical protein M3M98_06220 [Nitrospirota bacterium]|nr:hypothetical protein [Nitrospirota bacterium]